MKHGLKMALVVMLHLVCAEPFPAKLEEPTHVMEVA